MFFYLILLNFDLMGLFYLLCFLNQIKFYILLNFIKRLFYLWQSVKLKFFKSFLIDFYKKIKKKTV